VSNRREVITLLGGAAAWPLAARAQLSERMPRVGWLVTGSPTSYRFSLAAFRDGLQTLNYAEGRNIAIEYRWAEGNLTRLPELANELVQQKVAVILAGGSSGAQAAKPGMSAAGESGHAAPEGVVRICEDGWRQFFHIEFLAIVRFLVPRYPLSPSQSPYRPSISGWPARVTRFSRPPGGMGAGPPTTSPIRGSPGQSPWSGGAGARARESRSAQHRPVQPIPNACSLVRIHLRLELRLLHI
jgi:hypothetical protein